MNIHTISELGDLSAHGATEAGIRGKYVLLRDDFNVQIVDGKITDAFRIEQSLPTIRLLKEKGARIAICAHLGRPEVGPDLRAGRINETAASSMPPHQFPSKYSLLPIARALSELLGEPVPLIPDCIGERVANARRDMTDGDVVMLENVRFHAGEESNDPEFARQLADGFDIYVNDAFAVSHRAHASVVGVTKFLPSYAGELLNNEIAKLSAVIKNPARPLVGIISSSKVKSKVGIIKAMAKLCDKLILGGGIGTGFLVAMGADNIVQGETNIEKIAGDDGIRDFIRTTMKEYGDKIILPVEKGVGPKWDRSAPRTDKMIADILPNDIVMDEGPASVTEYERVIAGAKTVIWNGTVGMAEWPPVWSRGTFALVNYIAARTREGKLESIFGGGDAVAALEATGTKDDMTYVSTGGGAFLEFIEGRELPGIKALEK